MVETNIYGDITDLAEVNPPADSALLYGGSTLSWTKGGEQSLLIYSRNTFVFFPLDGITYYGAYKGFTVLYRGKNNTTDISGIDLTGGVYFYLYSFNGVQSTEKYNREVLSLFLDGTEEGLLNLDNTPLLNLDGTPLFNLS